MLNEAREALSRLIDGEADNRPNESDLFYVVKTSIAEQISQTEHVLSYHFNPGRKDVDRPDRPVKNFDLAALLNFYLERSERYGLVMPDAADEARYFLRHLDEQAYRLQFTRSAIVFDFKKTGTEPAEVDRGIEYYRIGRDLIEQLVEAAVIDTAPSVSFTPATAQDVANDVSQELIRRRSLAPGVPTLGTAAFLSPVRDRSVAWDESDRLIYPRAGDTNSPPQPSSVAGPINMIQEAPSLLQVKATPENEEVASPSPVGLPEQINAPVNLDSPSSGEPPVPEADPQIRTAEYDIMLGTTARTPQYGLLGEVSGRKMALDLNQTHTISLFGVQGGGKSYTLGLVAEMASLAIPGINVLPEPLATVIFHYSPTMDYKPEFTSMAGANSVQDQINQLRDTYGAEPLALEDVVLLVPPDKLDERRAEYPDMEVRPLQFSAAELKASRWKFLMGAVGNQATYAEIWRSLCLVE